MIENKKKLLIVSGIVAVLFVGGVGFAVVHKPTPSTQLSLLSSDGDSAQNSQSPAAAGSASQSVPLTKAPSTPNNSGLNVSTDTAANRLGQITPSQSNKSSNAPAGGGTSSGGSSSPFDPSTYAQYDKYKDGTSGLFGDAVKGDGAELTEGKKAAVYYKGWLTNGNLFDQSRPGSDGKLQPFVFTLGEHKVIAGWEQALVGMKVGGVRLVIVPPAVGYGAAGQSSIPPNSVLVFQVQLAAVQ